MTVSSTKNGLLFRVSIISLPMSSRYGLDSFLGGPEADQTPLS